VDKDWLSMRYAIMELLQKEQRLLQVVKLVGPDVLPHRQRLVLETCTMFKNTFLQQSAFDDIDAYSSSRKQFLMLKAIIKFYEKSDGLIKKGINMAEIKEQQIYQELTRMRFKYSESKEDMDKLTMLPSEVERSLAELEF